MSSFLAIAATVSYVTFMLSVACYINARACLMFCYILLPFANAILLKAHSNEMESTSGGSFLIFDQWTTLFYLCFAL